MRRCVPVVGVCGVWVCITTCDRALSRGLSACSALVARSSIVVPGSWGDSIILADLQTFATRHGRRGAADGAQSFAIRSQFFAKSLKIPLKLKILSKSIKSDQIDQIKANIHQGCKLSQMNPLSRTCKLSLAAAAFAAGRSQRANFRILWYPPLASKG